MRNNTILNKYDNLQKIIKKYKRVAIGFSGGIDSTFLAKVAHDILGKNVLAITMKTEFQTKKEIERAKKIASNIKLHHKIIRLNVLDYKSIKNNPAKRCYYCKKKIYSKIKNVAKKEGFNTILDASNIDDTKDYRPGMIALKELDIKTPLIEAKFNKNEIRELSKLLKLETWDKESNTCLATRIPYNKKITKKKLEKIRKAEEYIKIFKVKNLRVRYHDKIAIIEVDKKDCFKIIKNSEKIKKKLEKIGFNYIALDIEGYKKGGLIKELKR